MEVGVGGGKLAWAETIDGRFVGDRGAGYGEPVEWADMGGVECLSLSFRDGDFRVGERGGIRLGLSIVGLTTVPSSRFGNGNSPVVPGAVFGGNLKLAKGSPILLGRVVRFAMSSPIFSISSFNDTANALIAFLSSELRFLIFVGLWRRSLVGDAGVEGTSRCTTRRGEAAEEMDWLRTRACEETDSLDT